MFITLDQALVCIAHDIKCADPRWREDTIGEYVHALKQPELLLRTGAKLKNLTHSHRTDVNVKRTPYLLTGYAADCSDVWPYLVLLGG